MYLYDSYHTTADDWAKLLQVWNLHRATIYCFTYVCCGWLIQPQPTGAASVRGSRFDGIFIALYVTDPDLSLVLRANFDGIFTYFAATGGPRGVVALYIIVMSLTCAPLAGFTKGSTLSEWPKLQRWAVQNNKL